MTSPVKCSNDKLIHTGPLLRILARQSVFKTAGLHHGKVGAAGLERMHEIETLDASILSTNCSIIIDDVNLDS